MGIISFITGSTQYKKEVNALIRLFLGCWTKDSTSQVQVDRTTYNASRITKVYGTISCKGDETEERPHRKSSIISIPDNIVPTDIECIRKVVEKHKDKTVISGDAKKIRRKSSKDA